MKALVIALACVSVVFARGGSRFDYAPFNTRYVFEDSCNIDSTDTVWMPMFWQDNGKEKFFLFEARDDSSDGFDSDSFSVKIDAYSVFNLNNRIGDYNSFPYMVRLPSQGHPDSTSFPYSSEYILYDSLDILDMDTACVYARNLIPVLNSTGDTVDWSYGDSLSTLQTSGFGAFSYLQADFDYTPGLMLRIVGLTRNLKSGVGSFLRVRVGEMQGAPSKMK